MAGGGRSRFGLSVLLLVAAIIVLSPNSPAKAAFAGGTGTSGDPYQIADCTQLKEIDDSTANLSKNYILTANITCTGEFTPLKNGSTYFSGSLNGNGYSISGISITTCLTNCGIFAAIQPSAAATSAISNLTISNPTVNAGSGDYVGSLAGSTYTSFVNLSNVTLSGGTITGRNQVGGLIGRHFRGSISGSSTSSSTVVSGSSNVGGIVGEQNVGACSTSQSLITGSSNSGSVIGKSQVGGILGFFYASSNDGTCGVFNSSNSGSLSDNADGCSTFGGVIGGLSSGVGSGLSNTASVSTTTYGCILVGGVIGRALGSSVVQMSWNTASVTTTGAIKNNVGGVIGGCDSGSTIRRVFNTGAVSGIGGDQGGIAGLLFCNLSDSFSRSTINRASSRNGGAVGYGGWVAGIEINRVYSVSSQYGLLGYRDLTECSASFWEAGATTASATCTGISSKTSSEMKTQSTFTDAGWDFVGESSNGTNDYWGIDPSINAGYPYLIGVGVSALTSDTTAPSAPGTPDLVAGSDSGQSSTDNVTNDNTPDISVTAAEAGGTVTVTATKGGSSNVTCTMTGSTSGGTCTLGTLANGTWTVTATHADSSSNTSAASASLSITIDTTAPTASYNPNSSVGNSRRRVMTMSMNEAVYAGSGTLRLYTNPSTLVETYATSAVTISGTSVTITPTVLMAANTQHYVLIDAGFVTDLAGNNFAAVSSNSTWNYVTDSDATAPTATLTSPTSPTSSRTLSYSLTFSESVTGLADSDFSITGTATSCSASVSAAAGTNFTVTVTCSSNGTVDLELSMNTVRDQVGIDGPTTSVSATQVTINATSTAAVPPAAPTTSTTSTTTAPTVRTLSIVGAASRYVVTQDGPGLTAVPSAGGGAISWSSLTPGVCSVSTIAMMSILSAQSSVEVGRLSVVGTCTISASVAATPTHASASTSISFTVTRARPTLMVSTFNDEHFFAKITLPSAIASSSALLRDMYDELRFVSLTPEICEIDVIATYQESSSEYGSTWIGLHGQPNFIDPGACSVRAELPLGDRWFRVFSVTNATLGEDIEPTSTNPPTTTTVFTSSTPTTISSATTIVSSESTTPAPGITSFGPTSSLAAVSTLELDVEKQIVLESGEAEIVFTRESLIETAQNVGVQVGAIRLRTASSTWVETSLPNATDVRLIIRQTDVELNIEVEPELGEVIRISVPIVVTIESGFQLRNFTIAFIAGAVLMAWWLLVWRKRRRKIPANTSSP